MKNGLIASTKRHLLTPPSNCTDNYPRNNHNNLAHNKSFKLLSTNFRGIRSKVESFTNILNEESPDFIAGTESWLNSSVFVTGFGKTCIVHTSDFAHSEVHSF